MRNTPFFLATCLLLACSDATTVTPPLADSGDLDVDVDAGADDAAPDVDNGAPSKVYPAFKPVVPQVVSATGPVLNAAVIVPAFYPSDGLEAGAEGFLNTYIPSVYWGAMVGEYGPGAATVAPSVPIMDPAPTAIDDTAIKTWLKGELDGTHPEWPAPTSNSLYVIFYPQTTSITFQGSKSCTQLGGYHGDFTMPMGQKVAYAVLPRCSGSIGQLTLTLSHELVEAVTDPYYTTVPAYDRLDAQHQAWMFASSGGEIGDMCQGDPNASYTLAAAGGTIQRSWSNAAASAYHNPCVPEVPGRPYFQSSPVLPDTIPVTLPMIPMFGPLGGQTLHVLGVTIPVGQSKTLDVQLWSDGATGAPWSVSAVDVIAQRGLGAPTLGFAWDRTKGQNGEILHLTITAMGASLLGASPFQVVSSNGGQIFAWTGVVGN